MGLAKLKVHAIVVLCVVVVVAADAAVGGVAVIVVADNDVSSCGIGGDYYNDNYSSIK